MGADRTARLVCLWVFVVGTAMAAPADAWAIYQQRYAARMVPLLREVIAFPTVAGDANARAKQQAWLKKTAAALGLTFRDAGLVSEIELAGPAGAPVLGLIVHGDVQAVDPREWSHPPFAAAVENGEVFGRGAADDKGPLVQALLAMAALRDSGLARTHSVRLLVGSDEESANQDFVEYLAKHEPPALSLVLDADFPVVVGEKAWNAFEVLTRTPYVSQVVSGRPAQMVSLEAGLAPSIVPSRAAATLEASTEEAARALANELQSHRLPEGYRLEVTAAEKRLEVRVFGRAAHSGANLRGGRNALVLLAGLLGNRVQQSGAADLLAFAGEAGSDLEGRGLGLPEPDALWGPYDVNVATIKPAADGALQLTINIRSIPGLSGEQLQKRLLAVLAAFNRKHGARLDAGEGYFRDTVLSFHPKGKLVQRLNEAYARATGKPAPLAISGGGTYAKRVPRSIAFGMWFPGKPYPGHDTNEHVAVADLHLGVRVLLEALRDVAGAAPLQNPFAE